MLDPAQAFAMVRRYYGDARCGWLSEEVSRLRTLAGQRLSASEIANKMGRTRNSIIGKCDRLGIQLLGPKGLGARSTDVKLKRKEKRDYAGEKQIKKQSRAPDFVWSETPVIEPLRIGLLDLQNFHCRAVADGTDDNCLPLYCGHPVVYLCYCAAHAKVNFQWRRR